MSEIEFDDRTVFVPAYNMQGNCCAQTVATANTLHLASKQHLTFGSDPRTKDVEIKSKEELAKNALIKAKQAESKVHIL